jgi:predicted phage tail protein
MAQKEIIGSGGCFPQYAKVLTTSGYKNISEIVVGDEVISYNDTGRLATSVVEEVFFHKNNEVSKYTYWGGEIYATANHWVLNQLNSFSEIGNLSTHDCLVDSDGTLRPMIASEEAGIEDVYNLSVVPDHTYIVDGIRVHNGGGGKGGGASRPAVEDPNTLRSKQFARVLDLVSEGEIGGLVSGDQSVFINDVPLQNADGTYNFRDSFIDVRTGTQDQAVISDLNSVENTINVSTRVERPKLLESTYPRATTATTSLTLTLANHGYLSGQTLYIASKTGTLPENIYTINSVTADTYTITVPSATYVAGIVYANASLVNNIKTGTHAASTLGSTKTITKTAHGFQEGESIYLWAKEEQGVTYTIGKKGRRYTPAGDFFPLCVYTVKTVPTANTFTVLLDTPLALNASSVFMQRATGTVRSVTNLEADECYITMEVPQLTEQDTTTGDLHGSIVSFVINVKNSEPYSKYERVGLSYNTKNNGTLSGTEVTIRDLGTYNSTSGSSSVLYATPPPDANSGTMYMYGNTNRRQSAAIKGYSVYTETEDAIASQLVLGWRTTSNKQQNISIGVYKRLVGATNWEIHATVAFTGKNETRTTVSQGFGITNSVSVPVYTTKTVLVEHTLGIYEYKCEVIGVAQGLFGFTNRSYSVAFDTLGVIEGKTLAKYQRGYTVPLRGQGPWQVQVIRVEEEATKASISNELYWSTYTEVVKAKLNYPNSAMMYCAIDAEQFSSIPSRSYEIYGIKCKIPSNYDPLNRTYTGFWDGTFVVDWTDNPAWVFYDLITNTRYGLGDIVTGSLVDKWTLYSIAQYCDGSVPTGLGVSGVVVGSISGTTLTITNPKNLSSIGVGSIVTGFGIEECTITSRGSGVGGIGTYTISKSQAVPAGSSINIIIDDVEPRFTCNLYLQTREDAYKVVSNLASIFRGMVFWSTGLVTASQDSPKSVDAIYTAANVIDGTFTYTGTSAKTRHNVVLVSWNNPKNGYAIEVEYVQDEASILQNGIIQTELSAMGCTSQGQAHRLGKWLLYTEQYETETVSFKTGLDGLLCQPGDVIQTQDPFRSGIRLGGRVAAVQYNTGTNIIVTVDNPIKFTTGKTYTALFTKDDGTVISLPLSNISNNQNQIDLIVNTTQSFIIPVGSVWIVSVSDLALQSWRVVSISEPSKGVMGITALSYNEEKFNNIEYNHRLQPKKINTQTLVPEPVENITITEHMYLIAPQVLSNILSISWESPDTTIDTYQVTYKNITTNSNEVVVYSNLPNIEISSISEAEYTISVQAINSLGTKSQKTEVNHVVVGKTVNPADITNFNSSLANDDLTLSWSAVPDLDIEYYEIRYGTWGLDSANAAIYRGKDTQVTLSTKTYVSGKTHLFYIKAKDTSGNWSASYTLSGSLIDNTTAKILLTKTPAPAILPILVTNSVSSVSNIIALPNPATNAQLSLNGNILKVSWSAPVVNSNNISTYGYRIFVTSNGVESAVAEVTSTSYEYLWLDNILSKTFRIETIDNSGESSLPDLSITKTFTLPNSVTGILSTFSANKLTLKWTAPVADSTDAATKLYRIYLDSVAIAEVTGTTYEYTWADKTLSKTFSIETVDIINNVSPKVSVVIPVLAPAAPTGLVSSLSLTTLKSTWNHSVVTGNSFPIAKYNIYFGDVGNPIKIGETVANSYSLEWTYGAGTKAIHIEAVDINGNVSNTRTTVTTAIVPPNAPSNISATMKESKLLFSWSPATTATNSLPIEYYELREGGTSWTNATFVANIPASINILQYLYGITNVTELASTPVGTLKYEQAKVFRIASKDSFGLASTTQATVSVTLTKPSAINSLSVAIVGQYINAAWTSIITGTLLDVYTLPIDRYEIRATRSANVDETAWNNATSLASLSGSAIALDPPVNPSIDPLNNADGTWYYLIRAYDSFGTAGALANKQLTITKPTKPLNFFNRVIDNNILLNWEDSAQHSFPISTFMLKKSFNPLATYTQAETIGTKSGNFTTVFEETSGNYSYFLSAIDTAGNISDMSHTNAVVNQPPDYVLTGDIYRDNFNITSYGSNTVTSTRTNIVKSDALGTVGINKLIGPMSPTQTFETHFTGNSWTIIQDQPNAGYPVYAQPSTNTGTLTEIIDYGIVFNTNQYVSIATDITNIAGTTGTYQVILSTSADGTTYTSASSAVQPASNSNSTFGVFASSFRYVKVEIILKSNTTGIDLIRINDYRLKLSIKYTNDGGSGQVSDNGIYQILLSNGGSGYTTTPTITIGGNGSGAAAIASIGGITNIPIISGGSGYTSEPTIVISNSNGGSLNARAKANIVDGVLASITILDTGELYSTNPTVTLVGGGFTTAAILGTTLANNIGKVTQVVVTNSGSGYTSILPANITITGSSSVQATVGSIVKTSATSGTIVPFNYNYLDVSGIQITYGGTTPGIAIYDFVDITYPKFFRVLLFNNSGTPITGNFSWSAKGTI